MRSNTLAFLAALCVPLACMADPVALTSSGAWTASEDNGSFADFGNDQAGVFALILPAGSRHFTVRLANQTWDLPPKTAQPIKISFDSGAQFLLAGFGEGHIVEAGLPDSEVKAWTHNFTAFSTMTITFPGTPQPAWVLSLAGTTPTVEAMAQAITVAGITGLPAPWDIPAPVMGATPLTPTGTISQSQHSDCIVAHPVEVNGWVSREAELEAQHACERAYAERAEQQRLADLANARAAAERAERARAELDAELSPANRCRDPSVARQLMDEFDGFDAMKEAGVKAVDIEHLVTTLWSDELKKYSCHGVFVLTNGLRIAGSISEKPNVAGDMISTWIPDQ